MSDSQLAIASMSLAVPNNRTGEPLSPREQQLLALIAQGKSNKEAARVMGLAALSAKEYAKHIYRKIGVSNRVEATLWWQAKQVPSQREPE